MLNSCVYARVSQNCFYFFYNNMECGAIGNSYPGVPIYFFNDANQKNMCRHEMLHFELKFLFYSLFYFISFILCLFSCSCGIEETKKIFHFLFLGKKIAWFHMVLKDISRWIHGKCKWHTTYEPQIFIDTLYSVALSTLKAKKKYQRKLIWKCSNTVLLV